METEINVNKCKHKSNNYNLNKLTKYIIEYNVHEAVEKIIKNLEDFPRTSARADNIYEYIDDINEHRKEIQKNHQRTKVSQIKDAEIFIYHSYEMILYNIELIQEKQYMIEWLNITYRNLYKVLKSFFCCPKYIKSLNALYEYVKDSYGNTFDSLFEPKLKSIKLLSCDSDVNCSCRRYDPYNSKDGIRVLYKNKKLYTLYNPYRNSVLNPYGTYELNSEEDKLNPVKEFFEFQEFTKRLCEEIFKKHHDTLEDFSESSFAQSDPKLHKILREYTNNIISVKARTVKALIQINNHYDVCYKDHKAILDSEFAIFDTCIALKRITETHSHMLKHEDGPIPKRPGFKIFRNDNGATFRDNNQTFEIIKKVHKATTDVIRDKSAQETIYNKYNPLHHENIHEQDFLPYKDNIKKHHENNKRISIQDLTYQQVSLCIQKALKLFTKTSMNHLIKFTVLLNKMIMAYPRLIKLNEIRYNAEQERKQKDKREREEEIKREEEIERNIQKEREEQKEHREREFAEMKAKERKNKENIDNDESIRSDVANDSEAIYYNDQETNASTSGDESENSVTNYAQIRSSANYTQIRPRRTSYPQIRPRRT